MSRITGKVNLKLLIEKIEAARHLTHGKDNHSLIVNILNSIEQHPNRTYYSIVELLEASKSMDLEGLIDSVLFLSSKPVKIFSLQFCYYPLDNSDAIQVTSESYFEAKTHDLPPVDRDGREIKDFDQKRLGFSCFIHPEIRNA
ncbi:hypothetical protein [Photobacterium sanguinicancri]|uniref:hypothetical protein n=1 Tax=Photobacterium sanguinicancri TaxID=875932 RepID=UPI0021C2923E|nr:hypothetical protein [Photobacterium sanguinicancri]